MTFNEMCREFMGYMKEHIEAPPKRIMVDGLSFLTVAQANLLKKRLKIYLNGIDWLNAENVIDGMTE